MLNVQVIKGGRARTYYAAVKSMGLIVGSRVNAEPFAGSNVFCGVWFVFLNVCQEKVVVVVDV